MLILTSAPSYSLGGSVDTGQMLLGVLGLVAVLFGVHYVTRLVAGKASQMQQGRAVRVLDRFAVGKDKMFCLLDMAGVLYLVALSEGAVTVVDRIEGDRADELRVRCATVEQDNLLARGAGFLASKLRARKFDHSLESARLRFEEAEDAPAFARDEDDLDAMLRQISRRKKPGNREDEP